VKEGDRGEICFWTIGGVVYTIVECWAQSERGGSKIGNNDVLDEFEEGLPEEHSARRWWVWRHATLRFLDPTNHTPIMSDVDHPPKLLRRGEI